MGDVYFERAQAKFAALAAAEQAQKAAEAEKFMVLLAQRVFAYSNLKHVYDMHCFEDFSVLEYRVLKQHKKAATKYTVDFWTINDIIQKALLEHKEAIKQYMDDGKHCIIEHDCGMEIGDGYRADSRKGIRTIVCNRIRIVLMKNYDGRILIKSAYPI
jgi:hypothetical protein